MKNMSYDKNSSKSIELHAKKLYGKSLRYANFMKEELTEFKKNKGQIGQLIETLHFGYDLNSKKEADFKTAGVEVKTCPLKRVKKQKKSKLIRKQRGLSVKERLVLSMINYMEIYDEQWESNTLFSKIKLLLLMFYIHEKDINKLDYVFDAISLWKPSENDLKIIETDWKFIVDKIRNGRAHELSEGDTLYLGACTKGATAATSLRKQPYSNILAKQRAFSLKRSYVDSIYEELLNKDLETKSLLKEQDKTLDEVLKNIFKPFIGKTSYEIEKELGLSFEDKIPKNYLAMLSNRIMGTNSEEDIEEFQKANITLKTIRLKPDGIPKESISFPTFKFKELAEQKWDDSDFRNLLEESIFFFVVYRINTSLKEFASLSDRDKRKYVVLEKVKIWNMPALDIESGAKVVWETTRDLIKNNQVEIIERNNKLYNNFPNEKGSSVAHVRPHAQNRDDTYELPDGRNITKQCFWLNKKYIGEQLKD